MNPLDTASDGIEGGGIRLLLGILPFPPVDQAFVCLKRFAALPNHKNRNGNINRNGNNAHHQIDVAGAFEYFDELRADLGARDGAASHDQTEPQIDVAQRPVPLRRHDRFSHDVRQIGSDREVPIQPDRAQGRPGDEASAHSEKAAQNADEKSHDGEINRTDVGIGDRKIHTLFGTAPNEPEEKSGETFQEDRLADDEENGDRGIALPFMNFELIEPAPQIVQDQKKISDHQGGIDCQLDEKGAKRCNSLFFHLLRPLATNSSPWRLLRLRPRLRGRKFRCASGFYH